MSEELYPYYERELLFVRQFAQEFARLYPAAAGRLPGRGRWLVGGTSANSSLSVLS